MQRNLKRCRGLFFSLKVEYKGYQKFNEDAIVTKLKAHGTPLHYQVALYTEAILKLDLHMPYVDLPLILAISH